MKYITIILMGLLIWVSCETEKEIDKASTLDSPPPLVDTFPEWEVPVVPRDSNAGPQEPPLLDSLPDYP